MVASKYFWVGIILSTIFLVNANFSFFFWKRGKLNYFMIFVLFKSRDAVFCFNISINFIWKTKKRTFLWLPYVKRKVSFDI